MRARVGLALVLVAGCYDDSAFHALNGLDDSSSSTSGHASGEPATSASTTSTSTTTWATTSGGDSHEGSGDSDSDGASGGGGTSMPEPVDPPPSVSFSASPMVIEQAGPVTIEVEHSPDVEMLHLLDGDAVVASWPPSEPPPEYLILKKDGLDSRPLRVLAVDASEQEGLSDVVWIETKLPESGAELWQRSIKLGEPMVGQALASSEANGSIQLLLGASVAWQGKSMRLTAEGETAMVVQPVDLGQSWVGGVAADPDGMAVVVGTSIAGNDTRPWIARVNPLGDVLDLDFGKVGDAATGVAVDPVSGRAYVSGYRHMPGTKGQFDALLSARGPDGAPLWEHQWERPLGVMEIGDAVDLGWDVALVKNADLDKADDIVLVGESRFVDDEDEGKVDQRAFVRRYSSSGDLVAEWMSAPPPLEQAAARCVVGDEEGGLMVGGWSSFDPELVRSATIFFFNAPLVPFASHLHGGEGREVVTDLGRLPNDEIVYIADVDIEAEERHDFELRALKTPLDNLLWSQVFAGGENVRGNALTVTPHGIIVVVGTETTANASALVLAAHHP